jgi:hypothetical protein
MNAFSTKGNFYGIPSEIYGHHGFHWISWDFLGLFVGTYGRGNVYVGFMGFHEIFMG